MTGTRARVVLVALAVAIPLGAVGFSSDARAPRSEASATRPANPLAGQSFYVDPRSHAARQAAEWSAQGRAQDAAAMEQLAARPTATWLADAGDITARVGSLTRRAARSRTTALLVAYYIPHRECGGDSGGGAESAGAYRGWIRALARGIGARRAAVILEPDAIPQAASGCLPRAAVAERAALLAFAVRTLAARRRTAVYVDAGNAGWISPTSRLARPLRRAGIAAADGFALNVSNFHRTSTTISYGRALSRKLGGAHFVVDTGRNGNGPSPADDGEGPRWCNPPGRAIGDDPTTSTGQPLVDAYLWVKEPGVSDGSCRPGAPDAGDWWPEYALGLVRNSGR
jgi:endoglucanase